jgi:hypothetical protein
MIAISQRAVAITAALLVLAFGSFSGMADGSAKDEPIKLRAQLIWGTNDDTSPNPNHKEIDAALHKKLSGIFKWKSYFEVHNQLASIPPKGMKRLKLSPKCEVEIKNLGGGQIAAKLFGEGKLQADHRYNTARKEPLVLGSEDKNKTAWFVILSPL